MFFIAKNCRRAVAQSTHHDVDLCKVQLYTPRPAPTISHRSIAYILGTVSHCCRMYAHLRYQYLSIYRIDSFFGRPIDIIMAPSLGPSGRRKGKTSIANNGSTASSPSLRSKTPVLVDESRPSSSMGLPAGNVKVVVRVRAFLPRGEDNTV